MAGGLTPWKRLTNWRAQRRRKQAEEIAGLSAEERAAMNYGRDRAAKPSHRDVGPGSQSTFH